jgi:tetratricopeptide (TPR) repeat protein
MMSSENLRTAYRSTGELHKAIECHTQHLAIVKEVRDRMEEGVAYGNLGLVYAALGDFDKAIEYHKQDLAIALELGDRSGESRAYENLGNVYKTMDGDFTAGGYTYTHTHSPH